MKNPDNAALRRALGQFATGIAVVTARGPDGALAGLTVNSFASVSLDPPLVLWSLSLHSSSRPVFESCSHYAINVLAEDQAELSRRFAASGTDRFAGLEWFPGTGGAPLLKGCCARFECRNEARHAGGDHAIFVGRIEHHECMESQDRPLLYHAGRYRRIAP